MPTPRLGAHALSAGLRQRCKRDEIGIQEPAQPHALALPFVADPVHAIVPVSAAEQREPVASDLETAVERSSAVLEERRGVARDSGLEVQLVLAVAQSGPFDEAHALVENSRITRDIQVLGD